MKSIQVVYSTQVDLGKGPIILRLDMPRKELLSWVKGMVAEKPLLIHDIREVET